MANILVFSDTHLYLPFDEKKFNFLKKIITDSDQVIINGDFFDSYMINFNDFINSPWNQLFPLLKSKKTIYIFGNHDLQICSDERTNLFSDIQTVSYRLAVNKQTFIFTHGQQFRKTPDTMLKNNKSFFPLFHVGVFIFHSFIRIMTNLFGRNFPKLLFAYKNISAKRKAVKTINNNEFIIIGHNHWAEVDVESRFACCAAIFYRLAQYLTIDSASGKITLHEEWY